MSFTSTFSSASINGYMSVGSQWGIVQTIQPSDASANAAFGFAVDINTTGSYIAATQHPGAIGFNTAGSCYVFTGTPGSQNQQTKILPATGNAVGFGTSVSINSAGDTLAVGSYTSIANVGPYNGNVYIFTRAGSTWTQQQVLRGSDSENDDQFGGSISLDDSGDYCIIGADGWGPGGEGKTYIFNRVGTTWSQQTSVSSPTGGLGSSVQMSNDGTYAIIGAPDAAGGGIQRGSVVIYTRSGSTWSLQQQINGPTNNLNFGTRVAINSTNDKLIVAASFTENKIYFYTRSGSTWSLQQTINATTSTTGETSIDDLGNIFVSGRGIYNFTSLWNQTQLIPTPTTIKINGAGNVIASGNYQYDIPYTNCGILYTYGL